MPSVLSIVHSVHFYLLKGGAYGQYFKAVAIFNVLAFPFFRKYRNYTFSIIALHIGKQLFKVSPLLSYFCASVLRLNANELSNVC